MQTPNAITPRTQRHLYAAVAAALLAIVLTPNGMARTATATTALDGASTYPVPATMHDGVDWSRVRAMPVDTGATIGAYER